MLSMLKIVKAVTSGMIILIASEVSNRSTILAALIIALPLVSIISLTWIWIETRDVSKIALLSSQIFWFVIPSLPMFLIIPALLHKGAHFFIALLIGCSVTVILFYITHYLIRL
tara:strand:+ start:103 stop:444 length:342 start_codon:yes stop_codon:yes gene_type:complete